MFHYCRLISSCFDLQIPQEGRMYASRIGVGIGIDALFGILKYREFVHILSGRI